MGRRARRFAVRASAAALGIFGVWVVYHRWLLRGSAIASLPAELVLTRMQPRSVKLQQLERSSMDNPFDVLVVGGGASGLYTAVDAAQRGLRVALVEADDFGAGYTSSSPPLLPGAFPYVQRALRQRDLMWLRRGLEAWQALTVWTNVAPRLVENSVSTLIPSCHVLELLELSMTAFLATLLSPFCGKWRPFRVVRGAVLREEFHAMEDNVKGGIVTQDALLDAAAASVALARTAEALGALVLNYVPVTSIAGVESKPPSARSANFVVTVSDTVGANPKTARVYTRSIVNCAGPWVDDVRQLMSGSASSADPVPLARHQECTYLVAPRNAVHICDGKARCFATDFGAVLTSSTSYSFSSVAVLPWFDHTVLLGPSVSPHPRLSGRAALLPLTVSEQNDRQNHKGEKGNKYKSQQHHICQALRTSGVTVDEKRILSCLSSVVPVFSPSSAAPWATNILMEGHHISAGKQEPHIVHVYGGTLSFARDIAERTVDRLLQESSSFMEAELKLLQPCRTKRLALVGAELTDDSNCDAPTPAARVQRMVREEYATRVVDVLARRTHVAYSSPAEALAAIPAIAEVMRSELGWSADQKQLEMDAASAFVRNIAVL